MERARYAEDIDGGEEAQTTNVQVGKFDRLDVGIFSTDIVTSIKTKALYCCGIRRI